MNFDLTPQQQHWQALARQFAQEEVAPQAREADERGAFDPRLVGRMGELGFLAGPGDGLDYLSYALICEELGRADQAVRGFLTVHAGLVAGCLRDWGTDEQKARYLPRLASGEWIGCYALTEAAAGSDAAGLTSTAAADGDEYILNGEKIWITNGRSAALAIIFASRDRSARHHGICAFLVETATPGLTRAPQPGQPLGHRAAEHARLTLQDCRVPATALLGPPGGGFKVAMAALDRGRLGVAAGAVGLIQACLDACIAHTTTRRQFNQRLADFEMVQSALADMAADLAAARLLVYRAAWLQDTGQPAGQAASIAKLWAVEAAVRAADQAVLLHGNRGYSNEYPVERYYRDSKGLQIYEGTSHIQRLIIARELVGRPRPPAPPNEPG